MSTLPLQAVKQLCPSGQPRSCRCISPREPGGPRTPRLCQRGQSAAAPLQNELFRCTVKSALHKTHSAGFSLLTPWGSLWHRLPRQRTSLQPKPGNVTAGASLVHWESSSGYRNARSQHSACFRALCTSSFLLLRTTTTCCVAQLPLPALGDFFFAFSTLEGIFFCP